jgi:RND family efflux transporter MFP subunit
MFWTRLKTAVAFLAAGLTLFLVTIFALSAAPRPARSDPSPAVLVSPQGAQNVAVETVRKSDFAFTSTQAGTVEAFESVELTPRASGYVKRLSVDIGDAVKQGQVLVEIDAPELVADVEKSNAVVEQAQARLTGAKSGVVVAEAMLEAEMAKVDAAEANCQRAESLLRYRKKGFERIKDLVGKKAIDENLADETVDRLEAAKSELASATAQVKTTKAGVAEGKAKVMAARADLGEVEADLRVARADQNKAAIRHGFATIVSPLDGIVSRRSCQVGDFVRSGEVGSAPVLTLIVTRRVRVITAISDHDVPLLDKGDPATVRINTNPVRAYQGTISRTAFAEDPDTRTLRAEIDLENTDGRLRPGQYVEVSVLLENRSRVLTVPARALLDRRGDAAAVCYRVVDGRAVLTLVKTGDDNGMRVEILDGLKEGDTVIAEPGSRIKDGQAIETGTTDKSQEK